MTRSTEHASVTRTAPLSDSFSSTVFEIGLWSTGKLLVGPTEYSFANVAAPYAQELLDIQTARTFALSELGKQVRTANPDTTCTALHIV